MNSWGNKQQQTTATSYRLISTLAAEQKNGALAGASGALREKVGRLIPANKTSRHSEHNCIRSQKCQELPELYHHWKISPASPTYKQFLCFCFISSVLKFFKEEKKSAALYHNWDDGLSINKKKVNKKKRTRFFNEFKSSDNLWCSCSLTYAEGWLNIEQRLRNQPASNELWLWIISVIYK